MTARITDKWLAHQKRLKEVLGDKYVAPPLLEGRDELVSAGEAEQVVDDTVDASASSSAFISYTSAKGERSQRRIIFRNISGHFGKPEVIGAHCMVRERYRNFTISNIDEMICCATGEVLDPVEHCIAMHEKGALKIEDKVLARIMRISVFMARCDREFHPAEQSAIEDVLGRYFRFFGGDDESYYCALKELPRMAPTGDDVIRSVNWISKAPLAPELARFVLKASASIIDADGVHKEEEIDWGIELGGMLKSIAMRDG